MMVIIPYIFNQIQSMNIYSLTIKKIIKLLKIKNIVCAS